jgi:hypothetical protein
VIEPRAAFEHLLSMTDDIGTFEHADHADPRPEHGYCTDDMARVLIAVVRQPEPDRAVLALGRTAFRFLLEAQGVAGHIRNRRAVGGHWEDRRGVADCWGRSLWAFGAAARYAPEAWMRQSALSSFGHGVPLRSPWPRSMAFAALGAADVLAVAPHHHGARRLLNDTVAAIGPLSDTPDWPWPEDRLSYANAVLPEALLVAGAALGRPAALTDGLALLRWLLEREMLDGHLSLTPVGGADPADRPPRFDQQPIEAAAMADACARATALTGDAAWRLGTERAIGWFAGDNDRGAVMWDPRTGGGYDGLQADGPNRNQGTESTLALITTLQHADAPASASAATG